jgi:hypothetical protein
MEHGTLSGQRTCFMRDEVYIDWPWVAEDMHKAGLVKKTT